MHISVYCFEFVVDLLLVFCFKTFLLNNNNTICLDDDQAHYGVNQLHSTFSSYYSATTKCVPWVL